MKENMIENKDHGYVTSALIVTFILLRICCEASAYTVLVIALINSFAFSYVIYDINQNIMNRFNRRSSNIKPFERQKSRYVKIMKFVTPIGLIILVVYAVLILILKNHENIFLCFNDIISFIALGISIEATNIENRCFEFFTKKI